MHKELYSDPELYDSVLSPPAFLVKAVSTWIENAIGDRVVKILDPACGPGSWLSRLECEVAIGSDISKSMVDYASKNVVQPAVDIRIGDMRNLSHFHGCNACVAVNLGLSIYHVRNIDGIIRHLESIRKCLSESGCYIVDFLVGEDRDAIPWRTKEIFRSQGSTRSGRPWQHTLKRSLNDEPRRLDWTFSHSIELPCGKGRMEIASQDFSVNTIRFATIASAFSSTGFSIEHTFSGDRLGLPSVDPRTTGGHLIFLVRARK